MSQMVVYASTLVIAAIIIAVAVVILVSSVIIPALIMAHIPAITMLFLVAWHIFTVVPVVFHKIDALAAGIVFAAVLAPVFGMAWWYA